MGVMGLSSGDMKRRVEGPASAHRVFSEALWPPHNSSLSPAQGREGKAREGLRLRKIEKEKDRNKKHKGSCGHERVNEACSELRTLARP
ncbi:hypothetical protein E2C01_073544 [Portunus trituberculatus]|uniref:Uncharacterized protein n=1 Tax=Portunus trituberculatus TaxID=210409 RepID=A0A5B7I9P6_PORTR|nr:hypothetical protein [Portunus trituberculatus]